MAWFALSLLAIAVAAGVAARWMSVHPLLAGGIAGIPGALIGFLAGAATMSEAVWYISAIGFLVTALVGALGAFLGWLRRDFIQRSR